LRDSHHFAVAVSLSWSRRAAPFAPAGMCLSQASDLRCRGGDVRGLEAALPGQIWRRSRAGLSIRFSFGRPYSSGLAGTGFAVLICHNGRQCRKGFRVFNQIARVVVTGRQRLGAEKIGDSATWRFAVSLTANGRPAKASADRTPDFGAKSAPGRSGSMARRVKPCSASRSARRGRSARKNARRFCWDVSRKGMSGAANMALWISSAAAVAVAGAAQTVSKSAPIAAGREIAGIVWCPAGARGLCRVPFRLLSPRI
jgi:hypothetical protein